MEYRVEKKYLVSDMDLMLLKNRLKCVMPRDVHQDGDSYEIRSLYFDDIWNRCMDENEAGIDQRKKFRIRTYGYKSDVIHLEIKEKLCGLTKKVACDLTKEEYNQILTNNVSLSLDERKSFNQLKIQMRCYNMQPKVIIFYERTAFVYGPGNVRITFDRNIMASSKCDDLFKKNIPNLVPVLPTGFHVLEVKYDEFLPDFIADQLELGTLRQTAFSKYYLGRLAVNGEFPY